MTDKGKGEEACARCFLQWHSSQCGANYELKRAEEVFPKLKGQTRWDFVAIPESGGEEHKLALEVKRVIRPNTKIQHSQWQTILDQVSRNLLSTLSGTFVVVTPVKLNPPKGTKYHVLTANHRDCSLLVDVLTDVIGKHAASMKIRDGIDLGPQILSHFPSWPHLLRNACQFYLRKTGDKGLRIEMTVSDCFFEEEPLREAIPQFDLTTQLGLARRLGMRKTILLLDLGTTFGWSPDIVAKLLAEAGFSSHDVTNIYLVQASGAKVAEVWPLGVTGHSKPGAT